MGAMADSVSDSGLTSAPVYSLTSDAFHALGPLDYILLDEPRLVPLDISVAHPLLGSAGSHIYIRYPAQRSRPVEVNIYTHSIYNLHNPFCTRIFFFRRIFVQILLHYLNCVNH